MSFLVVVSEEQIEVSAAAGRLTLVVGLIVTSFFFACLDGVFETVRDWNVRAGSSRRLWGTLGCVTARVVAYICDFFAVVIVLGWVYEFPMNAMPLMIWTVGFGVIALGALLFKVFKRTFKRNRK